MSDDTTEPPFAPAAFLGNPHVQTVWPVLVRRIPIVATSAEVWPTPDGDGLDVDLLPSRPGQPGVLVLHGLESSSRMPYVRGVMALAAGAGWNVAALNFRTCGPSPLRGRRLYNAGDTRDLALVVERLLERWPGSALAVVGFSLGANLVLKWLGETGDAAPIRCAAAISTPFDLTASASRLDGPGFWPWLYRGRFMRSLRDKAARLAREQPMPFTEREARACRSFADFDEVITARLSGFASARDYWERSSAGRFLAAVARPTLVASAEDDPFLPAEAIPRAQLTANRFLRPWISPRGGHLGWVGGAPWRPRYDVEPALLAFLRAELG